MVSTVVFALCALVAQDPLVTMDQLARARDVATLNDLTLPANRKPGNFAFLTTNGVYGGGQSGWSVEGMVTPVTKRNLAVFTTNISCEDIGEQVFEILPNGIGAKIPETVDFGLQTKHYDMQIAVEPAAKTVHLDVKTKLVVVGKKQKEIIVRLDRAFRVDSAKMDDRQVPFAQAGGTVVVPMPDKNAFTMELKYSARLEPGKQEGSVQSDEMMLVGSQWWPSIARQAATSTIEIIAPKDWKSYSHGTRKSVKVEGDVAHTIWENSLPIAVFSAASGQYHEVKKEIGDVWIWAAGMDTKTSDLEIQVDANGEVVKFLSKFTSWPYPGFGSLISSRYAPGALEGYSFATYEEGWLPEVEPHEPAHSLWGGVIPNNYLKSLWNESFATYFENLYFRDGVDGNKVDLKLSQREIASAMGSYRGLSAISAGVESGPAGSGIGYRRGGIVLDMLEAEIGSPVMVASMKRWLKSHTPGQLGEWEDFEKIVTLEAERDMRWFFDQWLRKPGYPVIEMSGVKTESDDKKWVVSGDMRFLGQPYRVRMECLVKYADGTEEIVRLPLSKGLTTEQVSFEVSKKPVQVTFDPWFRILRNVDQTSVPESLSGSMDRYRGWVHQGQSAPSTIMRRPPRETDEELPEVLDRKLIYGDPRKNAKLMALWKTMKEPPTFEGDWILWRGQKVKISEGGFAGFVDLPEGRRCIVACGTARLRPRFGQATSALFDSLGQVIAARSEPARTGPLSFNLGLPTN